MYGLVKIHKPSVYNFCKFRPILSEINIATYNWAKLFVSLLKKFTANDHTSGSSFEIANEIMQQNSGLSVASQDVHSVFTNISLSETINICIVIIFNTVIILI